MTVAALGNLQIGIVGWRADHSQMGKSYRVIHFHLRHVEVADKVSHQFIPLMHTIPCIHLGQFATQFVAIAFHEATHRHKQTLTVVAGVALVEVDLVVHLLKEHIDRILLGIANETAGVHNYDVAIILPTIENDRCASLLQMSCDILGIDSILAAPKGDDVYFQNDREKN